LDKCVLTHSTIRDECIAAKGALSRVLRSVFERIDERNMAVSTGVDEGETMSALHIVDADGHIRKEVDEIQEYLDPPFAGRKFFFPLWPGNGRFRGARIHSTPPKLWQDDMDAVGIEKAVLYPTLGLSHGLIQ
jgi:hypothetical protein